MVTVNFNPICLLVVKAWNHISSPFVAFSINLALLNVNLWDFKASFSCSRDISNLTDLKVNGVLLL